MCKLYLYYEWLLLKLFVCHRHFKKLDCYFGLGISSWSCCGCYDDAYGFPIQFIMKRHLEMCALSVSHVWCENKLSLPPWLSLTRINLSCPVPRNVILNLLGLKRGTNAILKGDLNIVVFLITFTKITHCNFVCESLLNWRCYTLDWCFRQYREAFQCLHITSFLVWCKNAQRNINLCKIQFKFLEIWGVPTLENVVASNKYWKMILNNLKKWMCLLLI